MNRKIVGLIFCLVLATVVVNAKDKKKKATLPPQILAAQSIAVIVEPDAGVSLANPGENRKAVEDVEGAFMQWGRFRLADQGNADLLVVVRKGRSAGPVITNRDPNPTTVSTSDAGIYIGGHIGRPPDLSTNEPPDRRPGLGTSAGPSEDTFFVYTGRGINPYNPPLDTPALWRISGKKILDGPAVPAVKEFRKAVEEAEKAQTEPKKP